MEITYSNKWISEVKGNIYRKEKGKIMSLFNWIPEGKPLSSGRVSNFFIDCDALTDEDWVAIAELIRDKIMFSGVLGIPSGGTKLASLLRKYENENTNAPFLIVDDVLTTGASMEELRRGLTSIFNCIGFVVFARGKPPGWVKTLSELSEVGKDEELNF